ncbi:MAG TPA: type 1 periplasmic binding fold superfamily protein [Flavobacteriales bacterium]|nr:type 1 periplasmic binding fold superfamily protein [Flavobacteriales bacterium]
MNHQLKVISLALLATAATITGCKKDEDDPVTPAPLPNEEEVITTLRLTFTSSGGAETKVFNFVDADGDGGGAPVITTDELSNDSIYSVAIEVLNESETPAEDITTEIADEDEDHQFFFQVSGANATVVYTDADANGNPVGLASTWTIGAASNGTVVVTLRHEPNKSAAGVSSGDITNAGGDTDIEVTFPVVIE